MWNSCTSVFQNTCAWEQQEGNKSKKQKKIRRDMSMEKSKADMKEKRSPDSLALPNQNIIIMNII